MNKMFLSSKSLRSRVRTRVPTSQMTLNSLKAKITDKQKKHDNLPIESKSTKPNSKRGTPTSKLKISIYFKQLTSQSLASKRMNL